MHKIIIVFIFIIGFRCEALTKKEYKGLELFGKVLNLIQTNYVEEIDQEKLIYAALEGMLRELDPHSQHYPPEAYDEMKQDTSGSFGGIGIEITTRNDELTIISPIADSPAHKAGIKPGDKIVSIGSHSTKELSIHECIEKLKGDIGTKITLSVKREGEENLLTFTLTRERVREKSIIMKDFGESIGYFRISQFQERTSADFKKYLAAFRKKHKKISGLIIDLRINPGGILNQAVEIVDLFMKKGEIVSIVMRDPEKRQVFKATGSGTYLNFPIVVLINDGTASASEIVAGALQDHNRAVIIGTKSFGKGTVQNVIDLEDGSGLKLTIANYYTPSGRTFQAVGIMPDIVVKYDASDVSIEEHMFEKNLKNHLKTKNLKPAKVKKISKELTELMKSDNQLKSAYSYLKTLIKIKK
jgi:carboxyl-terminal processing protease